MTSILFGTYSKILGLRSERDYIRAFYTDVLQCELTRRPDDTDIFRIGSTFCLAVLYEDVLLTDEDLLKSIWLEIHCDDPRALNRKILQFGGRKLPIFNQKHFYFEGPGGQVFRVVSSSAKRR